MNKAFIVDGTVTVVEKAEEVLIKYTPAFQIQFVDCPDGVSVGDSYDGQEFHKRPPATEPPSIETRVAALEDALLMIL